MVIRKLIMEDAPFMLEWMKDEQVNIYFQFDASKITLESCKSFIKRSKTDEQNLHYAIVSNREYAGTISLKNIDKKNGNAEYAIAIRKSFQGKGLAKLASKKIIDIAFNKLNLHKVYLNVYSDNETAINLYEKLGFIHEGEFHQHIYVGKEYKNIKWYRMLKKEFQDKNNK